jgi:hypothetical protein
MAELIKEVTPPKRPDLSNPYQTASPVKPSLQKKPPKKRKAPEEPPKEQEKTDVNLSHQTIVESTVPTVSCATRALVAHSHLILSYREPSVLDHLLTSEKVPRVK